MLCPFNFIFLDLIVFIFDEYKLRNFLHPPVTSSLLGPNILLSTLLSRSRGSLVSIVSDYGLDDQGSIPDRGRGFFF
jgi:hypothetical protein